MTIVFIKTRTTVGEKREFKVYVQITRILYIRHTSSLKFFFNNDCNLSYCVDFLAQKMQMSAFSYALYTGRVNKSVDASEKRKSYYTSHNFSYFPPNTKHHIEYRVNIVFYHSASRQSTVAHSQIIACCSESLVTATSRYSES